MCRRLMLQLSFVTTTHLSHATMKRLSDRFRAMMVVLIVLTGTSTLLALRAQEALIPQRIARRKMEENNSVGKSV